jgi:hypothetical protein
MPARIHGKSRGNREYRKWSQMKTRCFNENTDHYKYYGARGITVCPEWLNDFICFYKDMGPCPDGYSLERTNNDKGYSKENCQWIPLNQQTKNTTRSIFILFDGDKYSITQLSKKLDISYSAVYHRIKDNRKTERRNLAF